MHSLNKKSMIVACASGEKMLLFQFHRVQVLFLCAVRDFAKFAIHLIHGISSNHYYQSMEPQYVSIVYVTKQI